MANHEGRQSVDPKGKGDSVVAVVMFLHPTSTSSSQTAEHVHDTDDDHAAGEVRRRHKFLLRGTLTKLLNVLWQAAREPSCDVADRGGLQLPCTQSAKPA